MAVYFSLFLVLATVLTGLVWLADKFYLAPQRRLKLADAIAERGDALSEEAKAKISEPNALTDTAVQVFPVIAFVLILRSFLYEPFQIPSGSMMPTLLDGDFHLSEQVQLRFKRPCCAQ